jgi:hypothetical protein
MREVITRFVEPAEADCSHKYWRSKVVHGVGAPGIVGAGSGSGIVHQCRNL